MTIEVGQVWRQLSRYFRIEAVDATRDMVLARSFKDKPAAHTSGDPEILRISEISPPIWELV